MSDTALLWILAAFVIAELFEIAALRRKIRRLERLNRNHESRARDQLARDLHRVGLSE